MTTCCRQTTASAKSRTGRRSKGIMRNAEFRGRGWRGAAGAKALTVPRFLWWGRGSFAQNKKAGLLRLFRGSCCKVLVDILCGNPALFLAGTSAFFQLAQQEKLSLFDGLLVVVGLRRIGSWKLVGWHSDTPFIGIYHHYTGFLDKMQHKFTSTGDASPTKPA